MVRAIAMQLLFAFSQSVEPARLVATQASVTCGWHFLDSRPVPPALAQLLDRAGPSTQFRQAADRLLLWYRNCDATQARMAVQELRRVRQASNSTDPLLAALLGIALTRGPDVQVEHAEGAVLRAAHPASNAEREGVRLLVDAALRTGWPEVASELASVAMAMQRDESLRAASETLWQLASRPSASDAWPVLAELELIRGDTARAMMAATRALASGSARGARVAGMIAMLAESDPRRGADIYLTGLRGALSPSDVQPFFDDLRLLLSNEERDEWNRLATDRERWIYRKWTWRAHMAGIDISERIAVNARRLDYVRRNYMRISYRGAPPLSSVWMFAPTKWLDPVDDRGMIYLRHGEPTTRMQMRASRTAQDVSRIVWTYTGLGSTHSLFEFDRADRADYFLAEPHPICSDEQHVLQRAPVGAPRIRPSSGYPVRGDRMDWVSALVATDPALAMYYYRCENSPGEAALNYVQVRAEARERAESAWNTETASPRFRSPLNTAVNLYVFRTPTGPELVTYLSIPATRLTAANVAGLWSYELDVRLSIGDAVAETVTRADTIVRLSRASPLPSDAVLHTAMVVRAAPNARSQVVIAVRNRHDPDQGQVMSGTKRVPQPGQAMSLSDIVVAEPRAGVLRRGTHQLSPVPGHAVPARSEFRVYCELYGARNDDPLAVTITVLPQNDPALMARLKSLISDRNAMSVEFDETAAADADDVMRIDKNVTADITPGAYRLLLVIRNRRDGRTVESETNLVVLDNR